MIGRAMTALKENGAGQITGRRAAWIAENGLLCPRASRQELFRSGWFYPEASKSFAHARRKAIDAGANDAPQVLDCSLGRFAQQGLERQTS